MTELTRQPGKGSRTCRATDTPSLGDLSVGVPPVANSRPGNRPAFFTSPDRMWLHWRKVLGVGPAHGHGGGKLCQRCRAEIGATARAALAEKRDRASKSAPRGGAARTAE